MCRATLVCICFIARLRFNADLHIHVFSCDHIFNASPLMLKCTIVYCQPLAQIYVSYSVKVAIFNWICYSPSSLHYIYLSFNYKFSACRILYIGGMCLRINDKSTGFRSSLNTAVVTTSSIASYVWSEARYAHLVYKVYV